MSGSTIGKFFKITTWGESHGDAIGVVIDGCPSGVFIDKQFIQKELDRRKPGKNKCNSPRKESDKIQILSGIFHGKSTGTPISILIYNENQNPNDYSQISNVFRPNHADFTYDAKYKFRDYRGGGRSSGRETASRVIGGAIAKLILSSLNIEIDAYTYSIGNISITEENFDLQEKYNNPLILPDKSAYEKAKTYLDTVINKGDSVGGVVKCTINGLKSGIGEPIFDKLDACLAKAIISIGATKGIEFGSGFESTKKLGSQNNDTLYADNDKNIYKNSNNSGGILGGISDGFEISFKTAIKPTPSISIEQQTITNLHENTKIKITGRHDPIIVPRIIPVIEAMTAITILDLLFESFFSKIENIKSMYNNM